MDSNLIYLILVIVLAGFFLWLLSRGKKLEFSDLKQAADFAKPLAEKLEPAAKIAVMAAEQYGKTGKLVTSEEKLEYAVGVFEELVPDSWGVSEKLMLDTIHSLIPWANSFGANIIIEEAVEVKGEQLTVLTDKGPKPYEP